MDGHDNMADGEDHDNIDGHDNMADGEGHDGMNMSMGDPNATPAGEVVGAEIVTGPFAVLDSRPDGYDDLAGTATIARHDGTTVTIEFTGLEPNKDYISHLHAGSCDEGGGPHYKFDIDGSDMPPNEIHLGFTSTEEGEGFMTAENDMTATDEAQSAVVHLAGDMAGKIACAQL